MKLSRITFVIFSPVIKRLRQLSDLFIISSIQLTMRVKSPSSENGSVLSLTNIERHNLEFKQLIYQILKKGKKEGRKCFI